MNKLVIYILLIGSFLHIHKTLAQEKILDKKEWKGIIQDFDYGKIEYKNHPKRTSSQNKGFGKYGRLGRGGSNKSSKDTSNKRRGNHYGGGNASGNDPEIEFEEGDEIIIDENYTEPDRSNGGGGWEGNRSKNNTSPERYSDSRNSGGGWNSSKSTKRIYIQKSTETGNAENKTQENNTDENSNTENATHQAKEEVKIIRVNPIIIRQKTKSTTIKSPSKRTKTKAEASLSPVVLMVLLAIVVASLFVIIFKMVGNPFGGKSSNKIPKKQPQAEDEDLELITEVVKKKTLNDLMAEYGFKKAFRMYYLMFLSQLQDKGLIVWKKEKTNREYMMELRSQDLFHQGLFHQDFAKVTSIFETLWYGEKELDLAQNQENIAVFERFLLSLNPPD
jgi:hypothetical protein